MARSAIVVPRVDALCLLRVTLSARSRGKLRRMHRAGVTLGALVVTLSHLGKRGHLLPMAVRARCHRRVPEHEVVRLMTLRARRVPPMKRRITACHVTACHVAVSFVTRRTGAGRPRFCQRDPLRVGCMAAGALLWILRVVVTQLAVTIVAALTRSRFHIVGGVTIAARLMSRGVPEHGQPLVAIRTANDRLRAEVVRFVATDAGLVTPSEDRVLADGGLRRRMALRTFQRRL